MKGAVGANLIGFQNHLTAQICMQLYFLGFPEAAPASTHLGWFQG